MIELILTIAIIIIPIILAGLLSAAETSITALSLAKIHKLKTEGNKRAQVISELRENKEALISTILLANSAFSIVASALATSVLIKLYGDGGVLYATVLMTILTIVFSEVLPKTYAIAYPEKVALSFAYVLKVAVMICGPITNAINRFVVLIIKIFKMNDSTTSFVSPTEELRGAIDMHHQQGSMDTKDKYMLDGIFDLSETNVEKVMTHRKNMQSISLDLDIKDIIAQVQQIPHTRIPMWKDKPDNIVGILNTRHLLNSILSQQDLNKIDISKIISEPIFIHENTALDAQLADFKKLKVRFAIVIDEYGDIQGIITLSDILSEVVGDIQDENDKASDAIICLNGSCTVKGSVAIRDINRSLHWNLPDDEASTIAGLLMHEAERIPEVGDVLIINNFNFTVLAKDANQLTNIKIDRINND